MSRARRGLPTTAGVAVPTDHRFRRPYARPGRRSPAMRIARACVRIGLPLVALAAIGAWSFGALLEADLLRVDRIEVHGATRLTQADVELLLDGLRGTNILSADLERYRTQLQTSTWVQDATLSRVLPSTIEVRVQERVPVAVARDGQDLVLVDAAGVLIEPYGSAHRDLSLPLVSGLMQGVGADRGVDPAAMQSAVAFLREVDHDPVLRERVSELDVSNPQDVVVLIDGDPAWLHLGDEAFVERLQRYLEWAPALRDGGAELDYVDLRFDERIVVRTAGRRTEWSRD